MSSTRLQGPVDVAHAYTPGLAACSGSTIRRTRRLPLRGEVLVQVGHAVTADQVVARTHRPGPVQMLNLAAALGVAPPEVTAWLKAKPGDRVERNQLLAERQRWFGWIHDRVRCPVTGTLDSVSPMTGHAVLREPPVPLEVRAYVTGHVVAVEPERSVEVETRGAFVQGIFGLGGESHGLLHCREGVERLDTAIPEGDLGETVLVIEGSPTAKGLRRLAQAGVRGVVCGSMEGAEVTELLGRELGVAVTGEEDLDLTVILTEGFGSLTMARRTFELLSTFQGREASVSGCTQIRAGVQRPEVLIPHDELVETKQPTDAKDLLVGSRVRLIRAPHFGATAEVLEFPVAPERIPTGAEVRVVRVRRSGGELLTVPRANVERIVGPSPADPHARS